MSPSETRTKLINISQRIFKCAFSIYEIYCIRKAREKVKRERKGKGTLFFNRTIMD